MALPYPLWDRPDGIYISARYDHAMIPASDADLDQFAADGNLQSCKGEYDRLITRALRMVDEIFGERDYP